MSLLFGCYVAGCHEPTVLGAIHKRFGRVDCCIDHNPARHAYDLPFGRQTSAILAPCSPIVPPSDGGQLVRPIHAPIMPAPLAPMLDDPF